MTHERLKPLLGSKVRNEGTSISIRDARVLIHRNDFLDRFLGGDRAFEVRRILLKLG